MILMMSLLLADHSGYLDDSIILLDSSIIDEDNILYSAEELSEEVDDIEIVTEVVMGGLKKNQTSYLGFWPKLV